MYCCFIKKAFANKQTNKQKLSIVKASARETDRDIKSKRKFPGHTSLDFPFQFLCDLDRQNRKTQSSYHKTMVIAKKSNGVDKTVVTQRPATGTSNKSNNNGDDTTTSSKRIIQLLLLLLFFILSGIFYYVIDMTAEKVEKLETQDVRIKNKPVQHHDKANIRCQQICTMKRKIRTKQTNGYNLLKVNEVIQSFNIAKTQMIHRLKVDYGDQLFNDIFMKPYTVNVDKEDDEKQFYEYNEYLKRRLPHQIIETNSNSDTTSIRKRNDGQWQQWQWCWCWCWWTRRRTFRFTTTTTTTT